MTSFKDLAPPTEHTDIAIIGLGYVGLTLAVALAETGQQIIGYEVNEALCARLSEGEIPFVEIGLLEGLIRHLDSNLAICSTMPVQLPPVVIVCVGTPIDDVT